MDNNVDPFKVYVRIRPLLSHEIKLINDEIKKGKSIPQRIVTSENNIVYLKDPNNPELYGRNVKPFQFDQVFTEKDNNKKIFESIMKKLIDNCLQGYNSTALAYGVTGAGKTHTMFGDMYINQSYDSVNDSNNTSSNNNSNNDSLKKSEKGISMYAIDYLFSKVNSDKDKSYTIKISYLELYNEQVIDLLTTKPSCEGIMIVEDPVKGVLVPDLSEICVNNSNQVYNYIIKGNLRRTKGSTVQNQFSSRSHAILEIFIEQYQKNVDKGNIIISKMLLVDLAGSEKGGKEKGIRRDEGANINRSLLALGNCINILSMNDKNSKNVFVPYRDSKLTRLLKDSLGGNIATVMIACVSPSPLNYEETHSTIKYASLASKIEKKVTKNIKDNLTSNQYRELILNLKGEIVKLKEVIKELHAKLKTKGKIEDEQKSNFNSSDYKSTCKNEDFYEDFINNSNNNIYDDFNNTLDNSQCHIDNSNYIVANDSKKNLMNSDDLVINFNNEIYENLSIYNLEDKSEKDLDELEKKLDNLYKDKINIEERLKKGLRNAEINEKYEKIKDYYEKYSNILNEKLSQNTENNLTYKFKLEELDKQINQNNTNIENYQMCMKVENDVKEKGRLTKKIDICRENISEIEKEISKNKEYYEKSKKATKFLKKVFSKYISYIQINDNSNLKKKYNSLLTEKRELEIKSKSYQDCFNSIVKESDKKTNEIFLLNNELEKMKSLIEAKDKTIDDLKLKLSELIKINKNLCSKYQAPFSKSMINFFDEFQSRSSSKNKKNKIHQRSTSIKNLLHQSKNSNNDINGLSSGNNNIQTNKINNFNRNSNFINSQVPIITAFIKEGDVYSHDNNLANSILNLKYNLSVKNEDTKSPHHKSLNKIKKKTISQSRKKYSNIKESQNLNNYKNKNGNNNLDNYCQNIYINDFRDNDSNNSRKSNEGVSPLKSGTLESLDNKIYSTEPNTGNAVLSKIKSSNNKLRLKDANDYDSNNIISQSMNFDSLFQK